jgi:hypothetical protein
MQQLQHRNKHDLQLFAALKIEAKRIDWRSNGDRGPTTAASEQRCLGIAGPRIRPSLIQF